MSRKIKRLVLSILVISVLFVMGCGEKPTTHATSSGSGSAQSEKQPLKQKQSQEKQTSISSAGSSVKGIASKKAGSSKNIGIKLEAGAKIKLSRKVDLFRDGQKETVALINLPLKPNQDYKGYLGIWNSEGALLQKLPLTGYNIMFPVALYTEDLTKDGYLDLVLETDEHANGGNGVHHVYVYIQQHRKFIEKLLPVTTLPTFSVAFQPKTKQFLIKSPQTLQRMWLVTWKPDQLASVNQTVLKGKQAVKIDPVSELQVSPGILTTKRLLWVGRLQLNGLGFLVSHYEYVNGKWQLTHFDLTSMEGATVREIKPQK